MLCITATKVTLQTHPELVAQSPGEPHNNTDHDRPLSAKALVWLSRAEVEERGLIRKRAWDGFERPTRQQVKWSSCRSQDARLIAFCRIEGATSNRKRRGAGRRGVRAVD